MGQEKNISPDGPQAPFLQTKLQPPTHVGSTIYREHLLKHFATLPLPTLTLVNAPAGYGKTTMLVQCYAHIRRTGASMAWLTLDPNNRDAKSFAAYVLAALAGSGLDLSDLLPAARSLLMGTAERVLLTTLINRIAMNAGAVYLFMDDYHQAASVAVDDLMNFLIVNAPPNFHLVVATRIRPGFGVAGLKGRQRLQEITLQDLRFSHNECQAYFGFTDTVTSLLSERSEGWPVALHLGRLWLEQHATYASDRVLLSFSGRSADLAAYLAEQVFAKLDGTLKSVLLEIAILDRFNGDLINAVCGRTDGWRLIEAFETHNLFLTVIDHDRQWFAFHHLFRDFLREQMRRQGGVNIAPLHVRAAEWYAQADRFADAIEHACLSRNPRFLSDFLAASGGWTLALSVGFHAFAPMRGVALEDAQDWPEIGLVLTYLMLQEGRVSHARELFERIQRRLAPGPAGGDATPALTFSARVLENVVRLYEDVPLEIEKTRTLSKLAAGMADVPPLTKAVATALDCYASYHQADYQRCAALGQVAVGEFARLRAYYGSIFIHAFVGMAYQAMGQLTAAERFFGEGAEIATENYGVQSEQVAIMRVFCAEVAYERNHLAKVRDLLHQGFDAVRTGGGWFDVLISGYQTQALLLFHDGMGGEALRMLDTARHEAECRDFTRLVQLLVVQRVRLLLCLGRIEDAAAAAADPVFQQIIKAPDVHHPQNTRIGEPALMVWAKLHIALEEPAQAIALLLPVVERTRRLGHHRRLLRAGVLLAAAYEADGETAKAEAALQDALALGEGEGFCRSFVDERASVAPILCRLVDAEGCGGPAQREYGRRLLSAMADTGDPGQSHGRPKAAADAAGLSRREQDILRLLAAGMSSKDMARSLELAEGTVKVHRKRLYRKLNAQSRYAALQTARKRGLLVNI